MIPLRFTSIEIAAKQVFKRLNVPFADLEDYSCCPEPVAVGLADDDLWVASAARNLALAEKTASELIILCNGCYESLAEAAHRLKTDKDLRKKTNELLGTIGEKYEGDLKVKHFIEFMSEDIGLDRIKKEIKAPVKMDIAVHYGCHLFRETDGSDTWRKPKMMRGLIEVCGANLVDYGLERVCCGFPVSLFERDFSLKQRLLPKLKRLDKTGAEAIVFSCPACINQFETGMDALQRTGNITKKYPCLHLLELMALAFGVKPAELSLEIHGDAVKQFAESFWK
jgi:heterodisulfide reductase subunit B